MPKKSKGKFSNNRAERPGNKYDGAEIFRNEAAVYDDTEPRESLQSFMEMFHGKIDDNVISMIYSECFPDVDQCLESLLNLSCEVNTDQAEENTSILSNESEKSNIPTPHSWLPENIPKISDVSAVEDGYTKLYETEGYGTAQAYDYSQTPSVMNFVESDSCLSSSMPNSFQYNGFFPPIYSSQMYPALGPQYNAENFPNYYYNPVPQNTSNYETKSYASQIKNNCISPKSNPLVSFSSKATSSPKNGRNGFKWNNTDVVKNAMEKIKMGCHLLIILRGLPGSGKSTLAKKLKFSGVVFTTDDYFYQHGKYAFHPSLLDEAHYWNQNRAREALSNNVSPVIIDNTNTEAWEMLPYIKMGKKFNYEIMILEPNTPWKFKAKELAFKNKHGVSKEKITKMLARYQHNITLDHFDTALSTSVKEGLPASPKNSDDNCNLVPITEIAENKKPYVSLEAVVHQEEQPTDILKEKDPNYQDHNISSLPKNFMSKEFPLTANEANALVINECSDTESIVEPLNDINENLKIDNLEELKSLAHEDSEDSQSLGKNDAQASDQDLTSWEEITEHDDDFLWKTSSSHDVSSQFHHNTLLENEELKTTNQPQMDLLEEKQVICHGNSIQCDGSSNVSCLPAPDVIIIGEPKSLRNNLHGLVDVLPENEECTSLESLNSHLADIHIDSDAKSNESITQQAYSHDINPDQLLPKKLNNSKAEKNPCHNEKKEPFNSHNSEMKRNFNLKTLSKLNDLNNFTIPSNHQLCKHKSTKSFDESYAFQEAKTKNEKSSGTNLLRSKFSSVPVLGNQPNISGENFTIDLTKDTRHNSYNEILFIETEVDIKKENTSSDSISYASPDCANSSWVRRKNSLKSICSNEKLFIENKLEISEENTHSKKALHINDLRNPSSWEGSENHLVCEDSMTELSDYSIIKSPLVESDMVNQEQAIEKESNNAPNFVDPKPQRGEKVSNMIFKMNINENKLSELVSTDKENFANLEEFGEWDCRTEPEAKVENEDNLDTNKFLFTPKPPRNFLQALHTPDKPTSTENEVKVNDSTEFIKPAKYKSKQRSPLFENALQYMSKDWVFPQFIQNQVYDDNAFDTENSTSYTNSDTQTELKDFIVINKIERNEACSNEYCIIEPSKIGQWDENEIDLKNSDDSSVYVRRIAMLEKSTSTEDLKPDIEISEKLARLNECFPHISEEDLNHLMGLCDNDETWVTNLLLDSEYNPCSKESDNIQRQNFDQDSKLTSASTSSQYNLKNIGFKIFNKSSKQFENETSRENIDCVYKNSSSNSTTESDSASDEGQMEINMDSNSMSSNSNPLQNLHLTLDPVFAMQLEELFGSVTSDDSTSTESSNTIVEIDLEFARLIHSKWKSSVQNKGQSNNENVDTKTKKIGVKLSGEENKKGQKGLNAVQKNKGEPMSLSEIMEMEQAVEHHKKEKLRKDTDIVTKKNRNKLYTMFPGADPTTLDEIFESNNCCFETSLKALEEDVGNSKTTGYGNLTLKECEGYAEILNESIDSWNKPNITSDFASNNGNDWTRNGEIDYHENNIKTTKVTTPSSISTITPEAEALREKAVEHYLMRQQCIQKSSNYYQRGMKPVASFYAQDASEHRRKSREANKAASELIAEQRNVALGYFTLDLHGLYVQEAIPMLDKFLKDRKMEIQRRPPGPLTKLTIITGQGLHSIRGPKLRPSVIEYLRRSGYFYSENHVGILEVYLSSDGCSSPRYAPKDVGYNID